MPTMRDPDHLVYYKPDGPGLLVGGYEPDTIAFGTVDKTAASPSRSSASCSTQLRPLRTARRAGQPSARRCSRPRASARCSTARSPTAPTPTS
jgi:hypothetical protein